MSSRKAGLALLAAVVIAVSILILFAVTREREPQPWDIYKTPPAGVSFQVSGVRSQAFLLPLREPDR